MASPWKLLARLVSSRREPKEANAPTDDVNPQASTSAEPTETTADETLDPTEPAAVEQLQPHVQIDAVSRDPEQLAQGAQITAPEVTKSASAGVKEAIDPEHLDEPDRAVATTRQPADTGRSATRVRTRRGKTAEAVTPVPQPSQDMPAPSGSRLDLEINLLRRELASKLQLQNAQLKKMLERFER